MQDRINPLTEDQLNSLPKGTIRNDRPVRFMVNGRNVNICTGILGRKGCNVIHQLFYWDRPEKWYNMVLEYLRENNPDNQVTILKMY